MNSGKFVEAGALMGRWEQGVEYDLAKPGPRGIEKSLETANFIYTTLQLL
jgi:hypothetical protein